MMASTMWRDLYWRDNQSTAANRQAKLITHRVVTTLIEKTTMRKAAVTITATTVIVVKRQRLKINTTIIALQVATEVLVAAAAAATNRVNARNTRNVDVNSIKAGNLPKAGQTIWKLVVTAAATVRTAAITKMK